MGSAMDLEMIFDGHWLWLTPSDGYLIWLIDDGIACDDEIVGGFALALADYAWMVG